MAFISLGTEKLHYVKMGSGTKMLLAFHGYGESAESFRVFEPYLGSAYTILSFDLPHHGGSHWSTDRKLTGEDLYRLVNEVSEEYRVDQVSLMGYSMGGRVCLNILSICPERIDKLMLLATDGLRRNPFYYFFTRTWLGSAIFKFMLNRPDMCVGIANALRAAKLISLTHHKLLKKVVGNKYTRKQLLSTWPAMSLLMTSPSKLRDIVSKHKKPVYIYMGAFDKLLPPRLAHRFSKGLETVQVFIPQKGHRIFDEHNVREIAQHLL